MSDEIRKHVALLAMAACALFGLGGAARAQYDGPPSSPYGLPIPGLQTGPDEQEPIKPWRHWGDSRNNGEFMKGIIAPDQVRAAPGPEYRRQMRFCRRHPEECGY